MSSKTSLTIDENRVVSMHYRLTDGFGDVIDSSQGGLPMVYMHNTSALLSSLERELTGHQAGDQLVVTIYPEDAYGYSDEALIQSFPRELLDIDVEPSIGMRIRAKDEDGASRLMTLVEIHDDHLLLDGNHPLAGKVLHFEIAIIAVREPTADELDAGMALATHPGSATSH